MACLACYDYLATRPSGMPQYQEGLKAAVVARETPQHTLNCDWRGGCPAKGGRCPISHREQVMLTDSPTVWRGSSGPDGLQPRSVTPNPEGSAVGLHPSAEMQQGHGWAGYRVSLQGILLLPTPCPGWIMLGPRTTAKHQSLNRSCSKLGTDPFIITPDVRSGYQHSSLQIPHSYFLIYF